MRSLQGLAIEENTISSCSKLYFVQTLQQLNIAPMILHMPTYYIYQTMELNNKWRALNLFKSNDLPLLLITNKCQD